MSKKFISLIAILSTVSLISCSENSSQDGAGEVIDSHTTCTGGSLRCNPNPQKCIDGEWVEVDECNTSQKCLGGECVDQKTKECDDGEVKCSVEGLPLLCLEETWTKQQACPDGKKCVGGACVSEKIKECVNNHKTCDSDGVPQICKDEKWDVQKKCSDGYKCLKGECVREYVSECKNGTKQCSVTGIPQYCQNEKWVNLSACKSDESCNKKTGECEVIDTCDETECSLMSGDTYMGNACIETAQGNICGCSDDSDCNNNYECNLFEKMCEKKEIPPEVPKDEVCGVIVDGYVCDGIDRLVECEGGGQRYRTYCDEEYGTSYKGDYCVTTDGRAHCGCEDNSDCKSSDYECKDSFCVKKSCIESSCKKKTANYQGDACVEGTIVGQQVCGCTSDSDCTKTDYKCNVQLQRCEKAEPEPYSICKGTSNGTTLCDGNDVVICEDGHEMHRESCKSNSLDGSVCLADTSRCGCNKNSDCMTGYECSANNICMKIQCTKERCEKQSNYLGNACMSDDPYDMICGCKSDSDCKTGYLCVSSLSSCLPESVVLGENPCHGKTDKATACDGNDVLTCEDGTAVYREACNSLYGDRYAGDVCVSSIDQCGCNTDTDCFPGLACGTDHICYDPGCDESVCKAATKNYAGNICIENYAMNEVCGCNGDDACKDGYECSVIGVCQEASGSVGICRDQSNYSSVCDGNNLVTCYNERIHDTLRCSKQSGDNYVGNTCLDSIHYCGCVTDNDCKGGYGCFDDECYPVCDETICKARKGDAYAGNACVDFSLLETNCGCESQADCNEGYVCDGLIHKCVVPGNGASASLCSGIDDGYVCDGNSLARCVNCVMVNSSSCRDSASHAGNICIAKTAECGCQTNNDCIEGYVCNSGKCEMYECKESNCTSAPSSLYQGNACVEHFGLKECGCESDSDCRTDYECKADYGFCTKKTNVIPGICEGRRNGESVCDGNKVSFCDYEDVVSSLDCKTQADSLYMGDVCIEENSYCGCASDSDCRTGFVCDQAKKICVTAPCSDALCKSLTGNDYHGNTCITSGDDEVCGCTSDSDCKDGFECGSKHVCVTACKASACKTAADYEGNACIPGREDGGKKCGCNEDSDCRDNQECFNNACIPATCIESDCQKQTGSSYLGNVCLKGIVEGKRICGCYADSDCNSGYECTDNECVAETCNVEVCKMQKGDNYLGDACIVSEETGARICGCSSNMDCKDGDICNAATHVCEADPSTPNPCKDIDSAMICDNNSKILCYDGHIELQIDCAAQTKNYEGNACIEETKGCGCNTDADCREGYDCRETSGNRQKCVISSDPCKGVVDGEVCNGSSIAFCLNSTLQVEQSCENQADGHVCMDIPEGRSVVGVSKVCGCETDADCPSNTICNNVKVCKPSSSTFSTGIMASDLETCENYRAQNHDLVSCDNYSACGDYSKILTYPFFSATIVSSGFNNGILLKDKNDKCGTDSITIDRVINGGSVTLGVNAPEGRLSAKQCIFVDDGVQVQKYCPNNSISSGYNVTSILVSGATYVKIWTEGEVIIQYISYRNY